MSINEFTDGELITASRMNEIVGAANTIGLRVDNTVGKRIFITDGTTEHMVSGDTGWRDISGLLINGWTISPDGARIRRDANVVTLRIVGINKAAATNESFMKAIPGFRGGLQWHPWPEEQPETILREQSGHWQRTKLDVARPSGYATFTFPTTDSWPTTLPGTPG